MPLPRLEAHFAPDVWHYCGKGQNSDGKQRRQHHSWLRVERTLPDALGDHTLTSCGHTSMLLAC